MNKENLKEKMKKFVTRKEVLAVSLVLFLFFAFYSLKLMNVRTTTLTQKMIGRYSHEGQLTHMAILKNNTLYGETLRREEYPSPLVESFVITYSYSFTPPVASIKGTYITKGIVQYTVNRGSEEIVLWEDKLFEKSGKLKEVKFSVQYELNLTELANRTSEITKQIGLRRLNRKITFITKVNVNGEVYGKKISEAFEQNSTLVKDGSSGLYYFTNEKKSIEKIVTKKESKRTVVRILGLPFYADTAKKLAPILALLFLTPLLGGVYTIRAQRPKNEFKDLKAYITEGAPIHVEKRVILATKEDLKKTFDLLDKPILHYKDGEEDVYTIIDGNIAYEYRHKNSKNS